MCWGARKVVTRWCTGKCEVERILEDRDMAGRARRLERYLIRSKALGSLAKPLLFGSSAFSLKRFAVKIVDEKQLSKKPNLQAVFVKPLLETMELLNGNCIAHGVCQTLRTVDFNAQDCLHLRLLDELWDCLQPDKVRVVSKSGSHLSQSWSDIGFQGKDPSTDFRGMGVFGLVQLHHFASSPRTKPVARRLLAGSLSPDQGANKHKFYPFCCAGLNISAFIFDLVRERKIPSVFYRVRPGRNFSELSSELHKDVDALQVLNELFCLIFQVLGGLWVEMEPDTALDFPRIFDAVKARVQSHISAGNDMFSLVH